MCPGSWLRRLRDCWLLGGSAGRALADDTPDQDLRDQVKALQKQVEELTKKVNGPKSGSTQAPRTDVDQSPSPNRAVNAKEAESAPKTAGPQPITWNGITLYGTIDVGVAYLSPTARRSARRMVPDLPFRSTEFQQPSHHLACTQWSQPVQGRHLGCRAVGRG